MNERILELAKQSGMRSPDLFKLTVSHMTTDTLEKFAELIVRECAAVAYSYDPLEPVPSAIAKLIQENFGVK